MFAHGAALIAVSAALVAADSRDPVPLDASVVELGRQVAILEDPQGRWTIDDVSSAPVAERFEPSTSSRPGPGYSSSTWWVRVTLVRPADQPATWILGTPYAQLDHIALYTPRPGGGWRERATGDRLPFATRELEWPGFAWRLDDLPAAEPVTAFVRVRTQGTVLLFLKAWTPDAFRRESMHSALADGAYFAFLLALVFYNLFLFAAIRDRVYLYYVLYLGGFVGFQASMTGHTAMLLWPGWPAWGNVAAVTFLSVSLAFAMRFVRGMTNADAVIPAWGRRLGALGWIFLALVPLLWIDYAVGVRVVTVVAVLAVFLLPGPIWRAWTSGWRPARYLVFGYLALFPGAVVLGLRYLGVLESSFWTDNAIRFCTALEATLLSFALADRVRVLREAAAALERSFGTRLLSAVDAERKRLAGELHDGLGHELLVLRTELQRLGRKGVEEALPLAAMTKATIADVRAMARALHPHELDRLGLEAAMEDAVTSVLLADGIEARCEIAPVGDALDAQAQLHLYRIVQEAVSNVARHAGATRARVALRPEGDRLVLEIVDDGVGVGAGVGRGLGLASMAERVRVLGGTMTISTPAEGGTRVVVTVPWRVGRAD